MITNSNEVKNKMKIIVDTCVWSLALRRNGIQKNSAIMTQLTHLIDDSLVHIIGPIRQELLSGISSIEQFRKLQKYLSAFEDIHINQKDYEFAAELHNICKKNGVQGSNTDFLICAISIHHQLSIFTTDNDFSYFANHIPITLFDFQPA